MTGTIFLDENIPYLKDILSEYFETILFKGRDLSAKELINRNCTALFARSTTKVNRNLLEGTNVKFVATATSGIDHIDIEYLKSQNICFASALGSNSNSVAEYVIYAIMKWANDRELILQNKTIGIIGFGNIGSKVAYYANLLKMEIFINDPPLAEIKFDFPEYSHYVELNELIEGSDIITNHVPLNKDGKYSTLNLLNESNLKLIKKNSLLLHCSRGKIVDESALLNVIYNKDISLVIDVFANEPFANKELSQRAIFATPHIAGYSRDGKIIGVLMVLEAFERFLSIKFDKAFLKTLLNKNFSPCVLSENNQNDVFNNIKIIRDIDSDSVRFKNIFNNDDTAKEFDLLRKNYPIRREYLEFKK